MGGRSVVSANRELLAALRDCSNVSCLGILHIEAPSCFFYQPMRSHETESGEQRGIAVPIIISVTGRYASIV